MAERRHTSLLSPVMLSLSLYEETDFVVPPLFLPSDVGTFRFRFPSDPKTPTTPKIQTPPWAMGRSSIGSHFFFRAVLLFIRVLMRVLIRA